MTPANSGTEPKLTAELVAEAAAWLAVLHGPNRTRATERGFSQWLRKSAVHARAFEEATGIWEEARNLPRPRVLHSSFRTQLPPRWVFLKAAAVAAALAMVAVGTLFYLRQQAGVETGVGEQRVLALDDGSRAILNTDTRLVVSYDSDARRVELKGGEALFEVAREPGRPFIVSAGGHSIEALGTAFVVRREAQRLAVTLVEGKVAVSENPQTTARLPSSRVTYLNPGDRVIFTATRPAAKDRPALDKLLAWQRREVALDNMLLADAVAEMNRYNRKPLEVDIPDASRMKVTGLFRAGDSPSFARAVAEAYHLEVIEEKDRIVLKAN